MNNRASFVTGIKRMVCRLPWLALAVLVGFAGRVSAQDAARATLSVAPRGAITLKWAGNTVRVTSRFSHPAAMFNGLPPGFHWNTLGRTEDAHPFEERAWRVGVEDGGEGVFTMRAEGAWYRIERRVALTGPDGPVQFEDTVTNLSDGDLGLAIEHKLTADRPFTRWWIGGHEQSESRYRCETQPTAYLMSGNVGLGVAFEDDVFRNQLHQEIDAPRGAFTGATRYFGLAKGKSYTFRWSLYPGGNDYFDFLNRLRNDWGSNYTVDGPIGFFSLTRSPWPEIKDDPEAVRRYFERKQLRILILVPWYLYDDGYMLSPTEYRDLMRDGMRRIRQAQPDMRFVACLEPSIQWVSRDIFKGALPDDFGFGRSKGHRMIAAPPAAGPALDRTKWADSLWRTADGSPAINTSDYNYNAPGWPAVDQVVALQVYPVIGNHRYRQFNEQIDFLVNEVGFDGVYFDLFNYAGDITYERWDGHTVMLDSEGRIARKYAMLGMLTADARVAWAERLLKPGKVVVTNLQPVVGRVQRLPIFGFNESWSSFRDDGAIPDAPGAANCQLASPLALGVFHNFDKSRYAESVMRCVMAYLRYGVLYTHYVTEIPETGPGSGEYGILNHMFPFTPVELHKGWVKGRERVLGCVSFTTEWEKAGAPAAHCFDLNGRALPTDARVRVEPLGPNRWRVTATLADWREFAVVE